MSSSTDVQEENVKKFRRDAREGKWDEMWETYKKERELRTEKITEKEDTVLHMALSKDVRWALSKHVDWAFAMVSLLLEEKKEKTGEDDQSIELGVEDGVRDGIQEVFGAKNKEGNTALHLAASMGYFRICELIGEAAPSLVRERNIHGETPLFLAANCGNKSAFLWLHYRCIESHARDSSTHDDHCIQRDDGDTILHCAIAQGHIDVAIEIFHLYRDDLVNCKDMKRNKAGLSPLHLLAATPSAFRSTSLHGRPIANFIYGCFSVKEKEKATTKEEVALGGQTIFRGVVTRLSIDSALMSLYEIPGVKYILSLLIIIIWVLLLLLLFIPTLILPTVDWLRAIRKMKEKHKWYGQIMNGLLEHVSDEEMSKTKHDNSALVETPLMIAAKNGAEEMVEKILKKFRSTINDVNGQNKNIVLLAAENRQTELYKFLLDRKGKIIPKSAFRQVDDEENTALHLAAMSGRNLNWKTTTMIEEFKWFELVKKSMPSDLREHHNREKKSAEGIFRESYGQLMKDDLKWLNKTSQASSVVSSLIASMVFPNVAASSNNDSGKPILVNKFGLKGLPNPYLVTLSLSLMSTISFLGILASRFQSTSFWMHVPFMLYIGMFFMFASLVCLWICLMLHDHSTTTYAILGSPIGFLIIILLPRFVGPTLKSMFSKVPTPNQPATNAIDNWHQKTEKKEK